MGDDNKLDKLRCLDKYAKYVKQNLTDGCKVTEDMYFTHLCYLVSLFMLVMYVVAVKKYCSVFHMAQECSRCEPVLKVAGEVMDSRIVPLSALYRKYFRSIYKSDKVIE